MVFRDAELQRAARALPQGTLDFRTTGTLINEARVRSW